MPDRLDPPLHTLFEQGLRSPNPTQGLRSVVQGLLNQPDASTQELIATLEAFRDVLRKEGREDAEDVVLEVMDFLVGWSSPHTKLKKPGSAPPSKSQKDTPIDTARSHESARQMQERVRVISVRPGTSGGVWVDRKSTAILRDQPFPPTAFGVAGPTVIDIDLTGMFPTPGVLQDFIVPLMQRIRGGIYDRMTLFVRTHDKSVVDFLDMLAKLHNFAMFVRTSNELYKESLPVGDLTGTERTTLNVLVDVGGAVTATELANDIGIEPTAASNRLVNLAKKGVVYRVSQPRREGDLFVDPRVAAEPATSGSTKV